MKAEEISRVVKERYSKAAQTSGAGEDSHCCPSVASPDAGFAAQQGLYTPDDLASAPELAAVALRAEQLHKTEFLQKPFSRETICEVVKKAIDSSSSTAPAESDSKGSQTKKPLLMSFIPRLDESKLPWKD